MGLSGGAAGEALATLASRLYVTVAGHTILLLRPPGPPPQVRPFCSGGAVHRSAQLSVASWTLSTPARCPQLDCEQVQPAGLLDGLVAPDQPPAPHAALTGCWTGTLARGGCILLGRTADGCGGQRCGPGGLHGSFSADV